VRAKLERRLSLIDERRHRVADVARAVARPPTSIFLFAAAGALAALFLVHKARARRSRAQRFARLLQPATPPEKSVFVQSLQKAATSLALVAVQRLGRRGLDHWLAEPSGSLEPLR
jgi:uncharacterized protein (DUF934 family)